LFSKLLEVTIIFIRGNRVFSIDIYLKGGSFNDCVISCVPSSITVEILFLVRAVIRDAFLFFTLWAEYLLAFVCADINPENRRPSLNQALEEH
jgi:hypothetical protein